MIGSARAGLSLRASDHFRSIEIKKMIFRIKSQRDGQTLAPDAIRGTSKKMTQAPAGRLKSPFQCECLSPRWGWQFFARSTPRWRTGLISNVPLGRCLEILFLNIYSFMKHLKLCLLTLVVGYTAALLSIEYRFGQEHVRNYFTDIMGPVRFYAVNTTLSAFLLGAIALIFFACWLLTEAEDSKKPQLFYASQALIFLYLGIDERFMLHEWWGELLDKNDAYFVLLPGVLILVSLYFWGALERQSWRAKIYLLLAAAFFAVMMVFDVIVPDQMLWRLSIEDLTKLWSDICLLLFAWEVFKQRIEQIKQCAQASATVSL